MGKKRVIAEIGQWVSAAVVLFGIVAEFKYKADAYLFVITAGTFFWAVVQKIKHPIRHKEDD